MKKIVIIQFLLISVYTNAQAQKDWAFGLSLAPTIHSGYALGLDAIRGYNQKWQLGFKSFVWLYNKDTSNPNDGRQETSAFGASIGPRFTLFNRDIFRPYILGSLGFAYQVSLTTYNYTPYVAQWDHWYLIYSVRIGSEVNLNESSWSIDFNSGYLGLLGVEAGDKGIDRIIISVGVLKRFE